MNALVLTSHKPLKDFWLCCVNVSRIGRYGCCGCLRQTLHDPCDLSNSLVMLLTHSVICVVDSLNIFKTIPCESGRCTFARCRRISNPLINVTNSECPRRICVGLEAFSRPQHVSCLGACACAFLCLRVCVYLVYVVSRVCVSLCVFYVSIRVSVCAYLCVSFVCVYMSFCVFV